MGASYFLWERLISSTFIMLDNILYFFLNTLILSHLIMISEDYSMVKECQKYKAWSKTLSKIVL